MQGLCRDHISQQWAGLKAFVVVERTAIRNGQPCHEQQFYIGSLIEDAQQLLADTVGHWGIENRLHWVREVPFKEDFPLRRGGNAPVNWAILHNFLITSARFLVSVLFPKLNVLCLINSIWFFLSLYETTLLFKGSQRRRRVSRLEATGVDLGGSILMMFASILSLNIATLTINVIALIVNIVT
ncbi:ISAs1 family transposase [Nostoc sp. FACHB-152]|uniref:ISAs1 family transposase n=1 Tax=unclassified Nostoc TaxID=2593658 RepID=UPI0016855C11|nr:MULTISPECIES: ISAs1 family transposase [unclassified Nostoc]MBD2448318.1 ISAs1 family transposase [Nostoc sp. FACHB-152]MBD2467480.1 ISAs1 family transposase [Nostoc sp. FACHB-145]